MTRQAPVPPETAPALRVDKRLGAARFFKTRGLAQQAVEGGRVKVNGERVKPARLLKVGDRLDIHIGEFAWIVTVKKLHDRRGPAAVARELYAEDESSFLARQELVATRRLQLDPSATLQGRPTKRDRRRLDLFTEGE